MDPEQVEWVEYYVELDNVIKKLEKKLDNLSSNFYTNEWRYKSNPESAAIALVSRESRLKKKISISKKQQELFSKEFSPQEIKRLKKNVWRDLDLLERAIDTVKEIEYYINSHEKN